jgi:hypothetical protein
VTACPSVGISKSARAAFDHRPDSPTSPQDRQQLAELLPMEVASRTLAAEGRVTAAYAGEGYTMHGSPLHYGYGK